MDNALKPFIAIYHMVSKVLSYPQKLFHKTNQNVALKQERNIMNKNRMANTVNQQVPQAVAATSNLAGVGQKKPVAKSEKPLISYRYVVINSMGKQEKGTFEAEGEAEVRGFLISQGYKVLSVTLRPPYDVDLFTSSKLSAGALSFALTQLSTYIKAGIPLVDSVRILSKQSQKPAEKKAFEKLVYELLKGINLSDAMDKQGEVFPKLLINMIKTAEMTGDLPSILDDMAEYYTSMDQTRKQMVSAMTYPVVVLCIAVGVLIFMLTYLVPQFADIFAANDAQLPALTVAILNLSSFIKKNYIGIIVGIIVFIVVFRFLYKNIVSFRTAVQTALMHTPVIKNIIMYSEVSNFTKTFASLINHGVYITDSMEILQKITNNEIYKRIINKCLTNLAKGDSISSAFRGEWAFPIVAYEMLVTGENTGQLGPMMEKVAEHFQMLHKNILDQAKSLMEPIMICALAVIVGIILLSIVQPMFSIYGQVG
jgi:type IV pilus assembly protein PilC